MCSFLVTNQGVDDLGYVNFFSKRRGPDLTNVFESGGFTFVHNLLSITGRLSKQPFVKDKVVCLYNGEIYNYKDFGDYETDGEVLIPLYEKHGKSFVKSLDGEFALVLVDLDKRVLICSSDVFATKPIWLAMEGGRIGLASYESELKRLGFKNSEKLKANETLVIDLEAKAIVERNSIFDFDVSNQHKTSTSDFIKAFENSIKKRTKDLRENVFIGLSSGYDSGSIACELEKQGCDFRSYGILGKEDEAVLKERLERHRGKLINLSYDDYQKAKGYLINFAEDFEFTINPHHKNKKVAQDGGAIGLSQICSLAKVDGCKVYLSGQGADEIFSDYGFAGEKLSAHSTFAGVFPDNLEEHFPWHNFYEGAQYSYLGKEEVVAGSYGIETRYPFLDKHLVQEFLWLSPELKNKAYKYPLFDYLKTNNYPLARDFKIGFVLPSYKAEKWRPDRLLRNIWQRLKSKIKSS